MNFRTLLLFVAILATYYYINLEAACGLFAMLVLIMFANLKRAMFEIPGALRALTAALRGEWPEDTQTEKIEKSYTLRIDIDKTIMIVRCSKDGWSVRVKNKKLVSCPRKEGASIEIK